MIEIKLTPYRNSLEPIINYKPTKITLLEDRLEYLVNYKYRTEIELNEPDLVTGEETIEDDFVVYDKGVIVKDSISCICVFIEDYGIPEEGDGNEISYIVGVVANQQLKIRVQDKAEADKVYKQIHNWKFNIKQNEE